MSARTDTPSAVRRATSGTYRGYRCTCRHAGLCGDHFDSVLEADRAEVVGRLGVIYCFKASARILSTGFSLMPPEDQRGRRIRALVVRPREPRRRPLARHRARRTPCRGTTWTALSGTPVDASASTLRTDLSSCKADHGRLRRPAGATDRRSSSAYPCSRVRSDSGRRATVKASTARRSSRATGSSSPSSKSPETTMEGSA